VQRAPLGFLKLSVDPTAPIADIGRIGSWDMIGGILEIDVLKATFPQGYSGEIQWLRSPNHMVVIRIGNRPTSLFFGRLKVSSKRTSTDNNPVNSPYEKEAPQYQRGYPA
jgi:hypothetical protein